MTDLRLVPKPEGFELRDKRSDKTNAADLWTPSDAVYAASLEIKGNVDAVTVIWRELNNKGKYQYCRKTSGPKGSTVDLMVSALGIEMGWTR